MKTIFLTGGSGFIGKNFIEHFSKKYIILSPTHKELDLLNSEAVKKYFIDNNIDMVVHCANIGGLRNSLIDDDIVKTNLKIFFNLVRNQDNFKKMIHLGSGAEYNKAKDIIDVKESDFDLTVPTDDYGFYKYVCSKYIENSKNIYCLRIFGIFGKYEDYTVKFISNLICKYIYKMPLTMIQDCYFDYIYINDFLKIIEYFIENRPSEKFYNVGSGVKIKLSSLAEIINKLSDYSLPIIVKKSGINKEYTSNSNLFKKEVKKFKITTINDAINDLYHYYLKNISTINKDLLTKNE